MVCGFSISFNHKHYLYQFDFNKKCPISITILDWNDTSISTFTIHIFWSYCHNRTRRFFSMYFRCNISDLVIISRRAFRNFYKFLNSRSDSKSSLVRGIYGTILEECSYKTTNNTFSVCLIFSIEMKMFFYSVSHGGKC